MNKEELIKNANEQLIGRGNWDIVDEVFTTGYIAHAENKEYKGHEFIKRFIKQLRAAIPDVNVINVQFLAKEENTIVWQRTLRGTHKANMMGIPPSGQNVKWNEMVVSRFEGDKILEEWLVSELAGQLLSKPPKKITKG